MNCGQDPATSVSQISTPTKLVFVCVSHFGPFAVCWRKVLFCKNVLNGYHFWWVMNTWACSFIRVRHYNEWNKRIVWVRVPSEPEDHASCVEHYNYTTEELLRFVRRYADQTKHDPFNDYARTVDECSGNDAANKISVESTTGLPIMRSNRFQL